jgi:hypothetical protein
LRFTVHRPASAEVSPCCHRPSGGDVALSVHIGVARPRGAGLALENRLALAVFGCDVPARPASLRRVRGRDVLDPAESLVLQTRSQKPPTASADSPVKTAFLSNTQTRLLHGAPRTAGHRSHVKSFDADRVEAPRDVSAGPFYPIFASIGLPRFQLRHRLLRAGAAVGAAPGAGQPLLQDRHPPALTVAQARGMQQLTGRQCRRHDNTTVDAYHGALTGTRDRIGDVGERDMPAASPIAGDPVGLHTLWDWARQPEAHPADLRHPHPTEPAVQPLDVTRFDRDLPEPLMYTGFAPGRAAVRSGEKIPHRLGEVPQCLLLHSLGASRQPIMLGTRRSQLSTLLVISRRTATGLPVQLLFDGQVPHKPGMATMLRQHHRLLSGWKQTVSRHPRNVIATTDKSRKGEAARPPLAKARGFHAATAR